MSDPASGLLICQTEIVRNCVEELARDPLPARADVDLPVVEVGVTGRATDIRVPLRLRVVVVDGADVEAEVAEGLLPARVEIHLDARAEWKLLARHARVPVADVHAARMRVVDSALDRRPEVGLRKSAEPVVADDRQIAGKRWWRFCRDEQRRCEREGCREWSNVLMHRRISLELKMEVLSPRSTSY